MRLQRQRGFKRKHENVIFYTSDSTTKPKT
jgi:hypothetical protein